MNKKSILFHAIYWSVACVGWFLLTESNHPTLFLRTSATVILVGSSAVFAIWFSPETLSSKEILKSVIGLVFIGTFAAAVITALYSVFVGPDPNRFSFGLNVFLDISFVLVNVTLAFIVATVGGLFGFRDLWGKNRA